MSVDLGGRRIIKKKPYAQVWPDLFLHVLLGGTLGPLIAIALACFIEFFFQAEGGIRDVAVTGVQTCALPICWSSTASPYSSQCPRVWPWPCSPACSSTSPSASPCPRASSLRSGCACTASA